MKIANYKPSHDNLSNTMSKVFNHSKIVCGDINYIAARIGGGVAYRMIFEALHLAKLGKPKIAIMVDQDDHRYVSQMLDRMCDYIKLTHKERCDLCIDIVKCEVGSCITPLKGMVGRSGYYDSVFIDMVHINYNGMPRNDMLEIIREFDCKTWVCVPTLNLDTFGE